MSVYIDNAHDPVNGVGCFHMTADSEIELEFMAEELGLRRAWREQGSTGRYFYRVNRSLRPMALALGAKEVSRGQMARLSK